MFQEALEVHRHIAPVRTKQPAGCPAPAEVAIYFTRSVYHRILVLAATAKALGATLADAYHGRPQFGWRVADTNWDEPGLPVNDVTLHVSETHCWIAAYAPFPLCCELTSEPLALDVLRQTFDGPTVERVAIADGWTLARQGEALELSDEHGQRHVWEPGEASAKSPLYQVCQGLFDKALLERDRPRVTATVVIHHDGSVINRVVGNVPVQVVLLDDDIEGGDTESIMDVQGEAKYVQHFSVDAVDVDLDEVQDVLEAICTEPSPA